jgi:heat shock protein HspQ
MFIHPSASNGLAIDPGDEKAKKNQSKKRKHKIENIEHDGLLNVKARISDGRAPLKLARFDRNRYLYRMTMTTQIRHAKFQIGQVVSHRIFAFRGIIFDVDPEFNNTEEWYQSIPEDIRPRRDQPFYHLFAENAESEYVAYVSEQNLVPDTTGAPLRHPQIKNMFEKTESGVYRVKRPHIN